jgi:hypothetical protein
MKKIKRISVLVLRKKSNYEATPERIRIRVIRKVRI